MTFARYIQIGLAAFAAILVLSLVGGSFYTVGQGERGVLLRFGAVTGVAQPGLGFKTPFVASVVDISVQSHKADYDGMHTYSKDQQPATIRLSVNYRVPEDRVAEVYGSYGSVANMVARLVEPHVFQETKVVFGGYTAVSAIQQREKLNRDIVEAIKGSIQGPVFIESVQVENIDFSKAYEASIEQRMLAEVEVQRFNQTAEREAIQAKIKVVQANATADSVRAAARAEADAITLRGNAEAGAIKARAAALAENSNLVALTQAERWDGKLPQTMIPGAGVPMIRLGR